MARGADVTTLVLIPPLPSARQLASARDRLDLPLRGVGSATCRDPKQDRLPPPAGRQARPNLGWSGQIPRSIGPICGFATVRAHDRRRPPHE